MIGKQRSAWLIPCALLVATGLLGAEKPVPITTGAAGKQAFDDLGGYYRDGKKEPPYREALKELVSREEAKRTRAGRYLAALLRQMLADESNGRAPWRRTPFWGGGSTCRARELRKAVAEAFGKQAQGAAALEAALWLIEQEKLPDNQAHGMEALMRIRAPEATAVLKQLLARPHPNESVTVRAVQEVGNRELRGCTDDVRRLCGHYRTTVRQAARAAAAKLGLADLAKYRPESAFTPWLERQLTDIAGMVATSVPADAKWVRIVFTDPYERTNDQPVTKRFSGWLLRSDKTHYHVLTYFGEEEALPRAHAKVSPRSLADEAKALLKLRAGGGRESMQALSRLGGLTAQFEPRFLSLPEGLLSAWAFTRGDRKTAAAVIFPRIDAAQDDRWLKWVARDLLGHPYHQQMLGAFSYARDYDRAIALGRHLSKPLFDGYQYQDRAKELVAQLEKRRDDFKAFRLPLPQGWERLKKQMTREQQVEYLARRLRLLNCIQHAQPGGVSYSDDQYAERYSWRDIESGKARKVINPYVELRGMKMTVAELRRLVPFMADTDFMLTFSYWRDFHPSRTLHRVNWAVASTIRSVAKKELVDLRAYNAADADGRKQMIAAAMKWCDDNAGKTNKQLVLESLRTANDFRVFEPAAREAVGNAYKEALPIFVRRIDEFEYSRDDIVEFCHGMNLAEAAPHARKWLKDAEAGVRFWAALVLLRHGDRRKMEGLTELAEILRQDDGTDWYPRAIEGLLATGDERAVQLACGVLKKKEFEADWRNEGVIQRLFLAGRRECLDYLLKNLDSTEVRGSSWTDGKEHNVTAADEAAELIAGWRTDSYSYDDAAPASVRAKQRRQLREWLKAQFRLIEAGKKPNMTAPKSIRFSEWRIDAP